MGGKVKNVFFTDKEAELLTHANSIPNFSAWVKKHLHKDMMGNKSDINREEIKRLIEEVLADRYYSAPEPEIVQIINDTNIELLQQDLDGFL
jgi:hypothetical protein